MDKNYASGTAATCSWCHSEAVAEISAALAKAQSSFPSLVADDTNPHFKNKFASLPHCLSTVREALTANGLALVQFPHSADNRLTVTTKLFHVSGQWMAGDLSVLADMSNPQKVGSAITYLRRYGLCSMLGIASRKDDDAEDAVRGGYQRLPQEEAPAKQPAKQPAAADTNGGGVTIMSQAVAEWGRASGTSGIEQVRNELFAPLGATGLRSLGQELWPNLLDALGAWYQDVGMDPGPRYRRAMEMINGA